MLFPGYVNINAMIVSYYFILCPRSFPSYSQKYIILPWLQEYFHQVSILMPIWSGYSHFIPSGLSRFYFSHIISILEYWEGMRILEYWYSMSYRNIPLHYTLDIGIIHWSSRNILCHSISFQCNIVLFNHWVWHSISFHISAMSSMSISQCNIVQDGAPKIAFSCLISGFMVDITIVTGS